MALSPAADAGAAQWVLTGLSGFAESVLSLVPAGFPAYLRVFHPALRHPMAFPPLVRWAQIAAANGTRAHAGMQLNALTGSYRFMTEAQPGVFEQPPLIGALRLDLAAALAGALARHTTTPGRCWFAVWNGFGDLPARIRFAPTFATPHRVYHLLEGAVSAAGEPVEERQCRWTQNLWWPDDRAWCVATEIDLNTTYIGCDEGARDDLLAVDGIEAWAIDPRTGVTWDSDVVNASSWPPLTGRQVRPSRSRQMRVRRRGTTSRGSTTLRASND